MQKTLLVTLRRLVKGSATRHSLITMQSPRKRMLNLINSPLIIIFYLLARLSIVELHQTHACHCILEHEMMENMKLHKAWV